MSTVEFARATEQAMQLLYEAERCIVSHPHPEAPWKEKLSQARQALVTEGLLKLVLTGEFSAGKSSLISALTGQEVLIGAGPTTQRARPYNWKGLHLVDTPGVQADRELTEHDRIARETAVDADLVLFVLTTELFNDRLAQWFHRLADSDGLALAAKMIIIVNKCDQERNDDEIIITEIEKVIAPQRVPIVLCAAKKYLDSHRVSDALREHFIIQSRMDRLVAQIDKFVRDKGATGRLTRPLQLAEDVLDASRAAMVDADSAAARQLELLRRQKRVLDRGKDEVAALSRKWGVKAKSAVVEQADKVAKMLVAESEQADLELCFQQALEAAQPAIARIYDEAENELNSVREKASDQLEELGRGRLADAIRADLLASARAAQVEEIGDRPESRSKHVNFVKMMLDKPLKELLQASGKNSKAVHGAVKTVAKKILKMKLRPWQAKNATKTITKGLTGLAKGLPVLTAALEFYGNYRSEKEQDEKQRHLARARLALHRALREQGDIEEQALHLAIRQHCDDTIGKIFREIEEAMAQTARQASRDKELVETISELLSQSRRIRERIDGAVQPVEAVEEASPTAAQAEAAASNFL
jgi:small GTP-binding protein